MLSIHCYMFPKYLSVYNRKLTSVTFWVQFNSSWVTHTTASLEAWWIINLTIGLEIMMFSGILGWNFIVMGGNHPGKSLPSHQAVKTTFSDWSGKTEASRGKDTSESLEEVFPKVFRYYSHFLYFLLTCIYCIEWFS